MLSACIKKEVLLHLGSFRFWVGALLTVVLTAASTWVAARDYELRRNRYEDRIAAHHDGCRVAEMDAALRTASVIVTATGFDGVLGERQLSQVADGAILVNVGHSDREIDVDWLDRHPSTPIRRHLERYELDSRRVYLLNRGSLVNLAAGLGIGAPQLFDPFAAIMLLGLDAILSGQTADLPNGVQRYPRPLEARVARALATGSV